MTLKRIIKADYRININECAFYKKCTLPKQNSLCNQFPEFLICPEYTGRKDKIFKQG